MFKTIALCASMLVSAAAFAEDPAPAAQGTTDTAQPSQPAATPSKTDSSKTKVSKVRKTSSKKGSQGRTGRKASTRGASSTPTQAPAPSSDSAGSVAK